MAKFTINDFNKKYPDDDACLERIFRVRYGNRPCEKCGSNTGFYRLSGRKAYVCSCGHMVYPLAGTIFHKSSTSLRDWFFAIYLFSVSKNGVSAKELERQLGVTYKTAWRMAKQIRTLFAGKKSVLSGTVEADETWIGGRKRGVGRGNKENKTIVFGMVERGGAVNAHVVKDVKAITLLQHIVDSVDKWSDIYTDEFPIYEYLKLHDFNHDTVRHAIKEYIRGKVHTNTIEGFWGLTKRSIKGTYVSVSPKYLQNYVNEFAWRYSHRKADRPFFDLLLGVALRPRQ